LSWGVFLVFSLTEGFKYGKRWESHRGKHMSKFVKKLEFI